MKIALTDKYTGEVVHTEAFFTRHSQHSPDGSLVMIFETGRELTGIVWRLAQGQIIRATGAERACYNEWLGQQRAW